MDCIYEHKDIPSSPVSTRPNSASMVFLSDDRVRASQGSTSKLEKTPSVEVVAIRSISGLKESRDKSIKPPI